VIFILLLFLLPNSFAEIAFIPHEQKQYFPGDFVAGTLKFDYKVSSQVAQLKGKKFLEKFYVSEIAIKNPTEAEITLIPLGPVDSKKPLVWEGIPVNLSALLVGQSSIEAKSFVIFERPFKSSFLEEFWPWIVILISLLIMGLLLWKIRKNKMFLKMLAIGKEKKILFWKEMITEASKRSDFEMIYKKRKEWMSLLNLSNTKIDEFFETLNRHQYKREWTEADFLEVQESYLKFKNGI
jgi:hypothetical protein